MVADTNKIAAIDCTLQGAYLIEASAGTGKTWTLTGIMLRLLVEKKYAPERIIATTFTKAAAAEMQERLQARLVDFYECCLWLIKMLSQQNLYVMTEEECRKIFDDASHQMPVLTDLVNQYLLIFLLKQHPKVLTHTAHRTKLLLSSLDKLFVGTLDSLAQKWLNEFKAEIGYDDKTQIVPEPDDVIYAIVHDAVRAEKSRLYDKMPNLYNLIGESSQINQGIEIVKNALNFYSADIDEAPMPQESMISALSGEFKELLQADFSHFFKYADAAYKEEQGIKGGNAGKTFNQFYELKPVLELFLNFGLKAFCQLNDNQIKLLTRLNEEDIKSAFKKGHKGLEIWQSLDNVGKLYRLGEIAVQFMSIMEDYQVNWRFRLIKTVKKELKERLKKEQQSTFYLQTAELNHALKGKHGENLAKHIRHLYPVALIDEAQDVSGEQANLIERIYLSYHAKQENQENARNFLLLVGDPKQAIYRFRGGDVANYNRIKNMGVNTSLSLTVNRRSNATLIDSINHWYDRVDNNETGGHYSALGESIYYVSVTASNLKMGICDTKDCGVLPEYPLAILNLDKDDDKYTKIANHICQILQSDVKIYKDDVWQDIMPEDIAILVRGKKDLMPMSRALEAVGIPVTYGRDDTVFDSEMAMAMYWLMKSVLNPTRQNITALFGSVLYAYDLTYIQTLWADEQNVSNVMLYLKKLRQRWLDKGVVAMLYDAFNQPLDVKVSHYESHMPKNLWLLLAERRHADRYLADAWHLLEILATKDLPPIRLVDWLHYAISHSELDEMSTRIVLPSEEGVKLMTIHKSKGLEFKVVYVLGLDGQKISRDNGLYFYTNYKGERRLSTNLKHAELGSLKELNQQEELEELKRIAYVALTRASELCFVVAQNKSKNFDNLLKHYLEQQGGEFGLPSRLTNKVSWITPSDDTNHLYQKKLMDKHMIEYAKPSEIYKKDSFIGISKTSFTALSRSFVLDSLVETAMPDYDESTAVLTNGEHVNQPIGVGFVRGINAGIFLHKALEILDWTNTDDHTYKINGLIKQYNLPSHYGNDGKDDIYKEQSHKLLKWLDDIVSCPLSASGVCIKNIHHTKKQKELKFVLGLDYTGKITFSLSALYEIFLNYGDKSLMSFQDFDHKIYGYLSGEIDLLYEYEGKYYVLDYKSNYLGDKVEDYDIQSLHREMDKHGYWLQAAIYQVALYRFLKLRIKSFVGHEAQYMGAVEYYFIRAADESFVEKLGKFGSLTWQVPLGLIKALDEFFGYDDRV